MSIAREPGINQSMVKRSLRKSKTRMRILMYLYNIGKETSIKNISKTLNICYSTTYGALMGNGAHYSRNFSLQSLGLVEAKHFEGNCFFLLTDNGRDEARFIKEEGGFIDRDVGPDEEVR